MAFRGFLRPHFLRRATLRAAKWATAAYFDAPGDALGGGAAAARGAKKSRSRWIPLLQIPSQRTSPKPSNALSASKPSATFPTALSTSKPPATVPTAVAAAALSAAPSARRGATAALAAAVTAAAFPTAPTSSFAFHTALLAALGAAGAAAVPPGCSATAAAVLQQQVKKMYVKKNLFTKLMF